MSCSYCTHPQDPCIDTYKHLWYVCTHCGTVVRKKKDKAPYQNPFMQTLIRNTKLKRIYGNTLIADPQLATDTDSYSYYKETVKKGVKGTKWESFNKETINTLKTFDIELAGARILDISGGPGFLSQSLKDEGATMVLTEFAEEAAQGIHEVLGLEAYKFDYNVDRIHEVAPGKFDLILCIYSVSYCNDIKGFIKDLKKILNPGGKVYIVYPLPTLGLFLRWQYDEYTYSTLHNDAITREAFEKEGFSMLQQNMTPGYHYTTNWFEPKGNSVVNMLQGVHRKIALKYQKKAEKQLKSPSLLQQDVIQLFSLNT